MSTPGWEKNSNSIGIDRKYLLNSN